MKVMRHLRDEDLDFLGRANRPGLAGGSFANTLQIGLDPLCVSRLEYHEFHQCMGSWLEPAVERRVCEWRYAPAK
jgi:hypothetical protein